MGRGDVRTEGSIRTVLVDDEPLARRGLALRLAVHADVEIVGQYGDGAAAVEAVAALQPDLLFLDVQMPGMDGFAALRAIPAAEMPLVVFVTAYDHHAVAAFEAAAIDYLLKPVEEQRLAAALDRVRAARMQQAADGHCSRLLALLAGLSGKPVLSLDEAVHPDALERLRRGDTISVREGARAVRIDLAGIRWIDAAGDYACVHTDAETLVLRTTMQALERQLDPARFLRIHRSTIVNARRVREILPHANGEGHLVLDCGRSLKLSRGYRDRLERLR